MLKIFTTRPCCAVAGRSVNVSTSSWKDSSAVPVLPPSASKVNEEVLDSSKQLEPFVTVKPLILAASIADFKPVRIVSAFSLVSVAVSVEKVSAL